MRVKRIINIVTVFMMLFLGTINVNADDSYGKFVWGEDNWQFRNSSTVFGNTYEFTEADREKLNTSLSNIERSMVSELIDNSFLGSCYGMAALSVLACYDLINYEEYRVYDLPDRKGPALSLYDMTTEDCPPTLEMKSLCNYYETLQFTDVIRQNNAWEMYNMTEEQRLQQLIDNVKAGIPTLVAYLGSFKANGSRSGHAVVAYDIEYGSYSIPDEPDRIMNGRIRLYDNVGYSDSKDYLYFNSDDMSWYCKSSSSENGGTLCMIISDINLLNYAGILGGTEYKRERDFISILSSDKLDSECELQKVAFNNGEWKVLGSAENEIKDFPAFMGENPITTAKNYLLPDSKSGYVMTVDKPEELSFGMNYENSYISADASNGYQAVFHPSGYVEISGNNTDYTLEMIFNDSYYNGSWYYFNVEGHCNKAVLQKNQNGYILKSDNLKNITVSAGNDNIEADFIFSTDSDSVLLYEINETTIGASIDKDGDGVYETALTDISVVGDVNSDDVFSVSDVILLQKWLTNSATLINLKVCDYDKNNVINVFDLCIMKRKLIRQ